MVFALLLRHFPAAFYYTKQISLFPLCEHVCVSTCLAMFMTALSILCNPQFLCVHQCSCLQRRFDVRIFPRYFLHSRTIFAKYLSSIIKSAKLKYRYYVTLQLTKIDIKVSSNNAFADFTATNNKQQAEYYSNSV